MTCKCGCGQDAYAPDCYWGKPITAEEKRLVTEAQDRALFNLIAWR